jgi:hypothetical protein
MCVVFAFKGVIDEVRIWSRALQQKEVYNVLPRTRILALVACVALACRVRSRLPDVV